MGPNEVVLHTTSVDRGQTKDEGRDGGAISSGIKVLKGFNCMTSKTRTKEDRKNWGRSFGEAMGDLLRILEAVDTGVDGETFPRAMFQASLELGEF